ncbi:MAG: sulfotransferase domain-containing protein, partial [Actinomycetia bacterium]|nr:sulfotransferase domain-containing protein [Actinomycetes bacterium]
MSSPLKDASPRWLKDLANGVTRTYATRTASMRPVPDFMVVGTKRGGTTSMFRYLLMHPGILGLYPQSRDKKGTEYFFRHTIEDSAWYRSHFHTETYRRLRERRLGYRPLSGEASPYYLWDPRIAGRVQAVAPNIKTIVLLRDPVKRAWSHYQERVANGVEPLPFGEALRLEPTRLEGELERMQSDP